MKINSHIDIISDRYHVQVDVLSTSAHEEELINYFGAPLVEVGNSFSGTVTRPDTTTVTVNFELPANQKRLPFDFPVKQVFDLNDDPESDAKAKVFMDEIVNRITTAKNNLISQNANFVGETTTTI